MIRKKKVALIRLDKIGDLICTLPVDQVLDEAIYDVTWIVQKGLGQLIDLGVKKRKYIELDKSKEKTSAKALRSFLDEHQFDVAISFQCPWWVNFELFKAQVPTRIGVLSQWHSFLFLNTGVRQKRSQALQHEFDYNLDLVKKMIGSIDRPIQDIVFELKKPSSSEVLEKYDLSSGNYQVVHPGMMGSALNCRQEKYIDYIHRQIDNGLMVVVTGTPADDPYLYKIKAHFQNHPQVKWLQSQLNFSELIQVIYFSQFVVVPSTGVAHIAASLGKHVKTVFSPIRVHLPMRWKPRGRHVDILMPSHVECPGRKSCLKEQCVYYNKHQKIDCMEEIQL